MSTSTNDHHLSFGWFIPTMGDTSAFGDAGARIAPGLDLFEGVARAAEDAGFEYALVPVQTECWEAWITCAMVAARTERLKMLVAARPGLIHPTVAAKMVNTFDQLTGGRVAINLIAGGSPTELAGEGMFLDHDDRYKMMDETVEVMKRLWTETEPVTHKGDFFTIESSVVKPRPFQQPYPEFYLGGGSEAAVDLCAKHADVYLFWGDRPEAIAEKIAHARKKAATYGREDKLRYGMRLQVIVRDTEDEAWAAAENLIAGADSQVWKGDFVDSAAQARMRELVQAPDHRLGDHLWSGISTVRPGAGVAVVGDPQQVADTLMEFAEVGCTTFCLSGYPHAEEATRFGRDVMPLMQARTAATVPA